MTARLKGRRREAAAVQTVVRAWAAQQADVRGLLTTRPDRHAEHLDWLRGHGSRARLVRDQGWGPLRERRARTRSGLYVELGLVPPEWARLPLDPGTARVLRDGARVLHDPEGLLTAAVHEAGR